MVSDAERTKILEMIRAGTITADEGMILLAALDETPSPDFDEQEVEIADYEEAADSGLVEQTAAADDIDAEIPDPFGAAETPDRDPAPEVFAAAPEIVDAPPPPPDTSDMDKWKRWWVIPLWIGVGVTVLSSLWMFGAYSRGGIGFWFACSWFPFLIGLGLLTLAFRSRTAPWLHVRVQQAPGETPQKIAISLPIPVGLATWGFRLFGHRIPKVDGVDLESIFSSLQELAKDGTPFFVDVNEGENGEKVQVFIG